MAEAPNKWAKWTDTEDVVVGLFPAKEAAELLGRTYQAVRSRRDPTLAAWSIPSKPRNSHRHAGAGGWADGSLLDV